jgi:hypothetical protein
MEATTENNKQLIEREKIEGTPFTLIKQNEQYFLVMGDHRLTEPTKNRETTMIKLENEKWLLMTQVVICILESMNKQAEILNNIKNQ